MNANAILYFVKFPTPGKVKTRLAKTLGDEKAAEIYRQLALENFYVLRQCRNADLVVYFDPPEDQQKVQQWLPGADQYIPQMGIDLGDRLKHVFQFGFGYGYQKVCAYGSDTLQLTLTIVEQGFVALREADVVIGPAKDGGYYLMGTASYQPDLFENVPWSTTEVLSETYKKICQSQLKHHLLVPLEDLDEVKSGGDNGFINSQIEKRRS